MDDRQLATLDDSEAEQTAEDDDFMPDTVGHTPKAKARGKKRKAKAASVEADAEEDLAGVDDGNEKVYRNRVDKWSSSRAAACC
jgi:DNA excision repair protein ERCC-6